MTTRIKTGFGDAPGKPLINRDTCTACGLCARVCKAGNMFVEDGGSMRITGDSFLACIGCGHCMLICPTRSISVEGRNLAPGDVMELPPPERRAGFDLLRGLMLSRRSVREFKEETPNRETINRILDLAASAPMGIPPSDVQVTVFHGRDRVREFTGDMIDAFAKSKRLFNATTLKFMRPFIGKIMYESFTTFIVPILDFVVGKKRKHNEDWLFYDAPVVLLFHQSPYADPLDGVIACTYAMLAAEAEGLGTCMIGTVAHFIPYNKQLMKKYAIPVTNKVCIALILGVPDVKYKRALKRRFAAVNYS